MKEAEYKVAVRCDMPQARNPGSLTRYMILRMRTPERSQICAAIA